MAIFLWTKSTCSKYEKLKSRCAIILIKSQYLSEVKQINRPYTLSVRSLQYRSTICFRWTGNVVMLTVLSLLVSYSSDMIISLIRDPSCYNSLSHVCSCLAIAASEWWKLKLLIALSHSGIFAFYLGLPPMCYLNNMFVILDYVFASEIISAVHL